MNKWKADTGDEEKAATLRHRPVVFFWGGWFFLDKWSVPNQMLILKMCDHHSGSVAVYIASGYTSVLYSINLVNGQNTRFIDQKNSNYQLTNKSKKGKKLIRNLIFN